MPPGKQDILTIEKAMVRDFNIGKMEALLARFHPRVVGFSSTRQERITGRPRHAIHGRGSHIFAKHNGKWLIVHEHFSRAH